MLIFMQVIIGKVLIFSPNLQRKVLPSLFPSRWLYFNQKQTAKQHLLCTELTVLAGSQEVHYGKTTSMLSLTASPFLCLTEVIIWLDVLPLECREDFSHVKTKTKKKTKHYNQTNLKLCFVSIKITQESHCHINVEYIKNIKTNS